MNSLQPPWAEIDTVLLDMDGTLLDLHFDTHFWLEHVPVRYAEANKLPLELAREQLMKRYRKAEGTLEWYCVDYWSDQLKLDIEILKQEVDHGKSLSLKMKKTPIGEHLDEIITAHDIGLPKEDSNFWEKLQQRQPFSAANTLLIDDSINVLNSAEKYGIKHLRAILQPNSKLDPDPHDRYIHIDRFAEIMPLSEQQE
jgi:putative hydrolase of the HAD superfamily